MKEESFEGIAAGRSGAAVAPLDLLGGTKGRPKKEGRTENLVAQGVTPGETLKGSSTSWKIMGLSASSLTGRVWRGASAN
ncbi:MAG: hypothetical protein ACLTTP_11085 [Alistipes ihumii]